MSDSFMLCPKCGGEVQWIGWFIGKEKAYYCPNCEKVMKESEVRIVATEYLKGEEDEQGNQSRRSKK